MINLLDICKIGGSAVKEFDGKKKYIATGDVNDNSIVTYEMVEFSNKPSRANVEIKKDDVLFAKMINTEKVLMSDDKKTKNIYSTGFYCITPNENVLQKYLYFLFKSKSFNVQKNRNCSGATQKAINNEGLKKIKVKNLPDIDEQKNIVHSLSILEKLINIKKTEIEEMEQIVKSQFVEMFGTNKKSKYVFDSLNNLTLKITDGKHGGCNGDNNSGFYFVGATEIYNNKINYQTAKEITKNDFEKDYKRCDLKNNDFVIVNTGATIGKSAVVNSNVTDHTLLQKSVALIRTKDDVLNPLYLKYCYEINPDMYNKGNGCARINLLLSQIKETMIPVPPIELQNKFADIVKQIDKQKFSNMNILELLVKIVVL